MYCGGIFEVPLNGGHVTAKAYGKHYTPFDEVRCEVCGREAVDYFNLLSLGSPFKCTGAEFFVCVECGNDKCGEVE